MKQFRLFFCAIFALMACCSFAQNSISDKLMARSAMMAAQAGGYDDDEPADLVTKGYIEDLGNKLILHFESSSAMAGKWVKGVMGAEFDGSSDSSLCTKAYAKITTNVPGEEDTEEDMTEDFAGVPKYFIRMTFEEMLDIMEDGPSSIKAISTTHFFKNIYDTNGRQLPSFKKGINIIKSGDGKVRKVMVK